LFGTDLPCDRRGLRVIAVLLVDPSADRRAVERRVVAIQLDIGDPNIRPRAAVGGRWDACRATGARAGRARAAGSSSTGAICTGIDGRAPRPARAAGTAGRAGPSGSRSASDRAGAA